MVNSSKMEFQDRPLAVACPLRWTRSGHLSLSVAELLAGAQSTRLVTWMHVLSCSLASNDEEWFPASGA